MSDTTHIIDGKENPAFKPGEDVKVSGVYDELDEDGKATGRGATCTAGEPFPPTEDNGYAWRLREPSNME